MDKEEAWNKC
jgi:sodium/potassium-transporting ATPase subunit alpha